VRLVEGSIEDIYYGRAINGIRNHYLEIAGDKASLFMLSAHSDPEGGERVFRVELGRVREPRRR
jgi:hypothetical protein